MPAFGKKLTDGRDQGARGRGPTPGEEVIRNRPAQPRLGDFGVRPPPDGRAAVSPPTPGPRTATDLARFLGVSFGCLPEPAGGRAIETGDVDALAVRSWLASLRADGLAKTLDRTAPLGAPDLLRVPRARGARGRRTRRGRRRRRDARRRSREPCPSPKPRAVVEAPRREDAPRRSRPGAPRAPLRDGAPRLRARRPAPRTDVDLSGRQVRTVGKGRKERSSRSARRPPRRSRLAAGAGRPPRGRGAGRASPSS